MKIKKDTSALLSGLTLSLTLPLCGSFVACAPPAPPADTADATPPPVASDELPDAQSVPRDEPKAVVAPASQPQKTAALAVLADVGFATPECVFYDAAQDLSFISNINGAPLEKDDNGFISRLKSDGSLELKFIDGADPAFSLNAPKGLAVANGTLYVADIDTVHLFNAESGAYLKSIEIPKSDFLNDIAIDQAGVVYVTDTALDSNFASTKNDAIYQIKDGKVSTYAQSEMLGGANGIAVTSEGLLVSSFVSGELYRLNAAGEMSAQQKIEGGQLDGLIVTNTGDYLVSSWGASAILRGAPGGDFKVVADELKAPADIGYDSKRNQVLVPLFMSNEVRIYALD